MTSQSKGKVYVGMSGGVDSSVSAALLKQGGYDVTGVFIKTWTPDWMECSWREDRLDAMRVAAHIGIPFITIDLTNEYKQGVVDYMISEYKVGRIPNPDVMCNKTVKFGAFFAWAMKQGADFIATGHYAQIAHSKSQIAYNQKKEFDLPSAISYKLLAGLDQGKDQSYFLWTLTNKELSKILFPVGGFKKDETRKLAKKIGLPNAEKKDSQGLCFIGKVDIREFLGHYIESKKGQVLDEKGLVVGEHDGALFYTPGERHGFHISVKTPDDKPLYVISKDVLKNTITVAPKSPQSSLPTEKKEFMLENTNWISDVPKTNYPYYARIRHLGDFLSSKITLLKNNSVELVFDKPLIVAGGQSVVIYDRDICLGGGIVS